MKNDEFQCESALFKNGFLWFLDFVCCFWNDNLIYDVDG